MAAVRRDNLIYALDPPNALRPEVVRPRQFDDEGVRRLAHVLLRLRNTIRHLAPRLAPRARRRRAVRVVGGLEEACGAVVVRGARVDLVARPDDAVAGRGDVGGAVVAVAWLRHCESVGSSSRYGRPLPQLLAAHRAHCLVSPHVPLRGCL